MEDKILLPILAAQKEKAITAINKCNEYTSQFGLTLTSNDINDIIKCQHETLKIMGRIELGDTIIPKLVFEFCDSQYISQDNYVEILEDLQEAFYYFKNESMDELSDDELIQGMKKYFDLECQGSVEALKSTYLEELCRNARYSMDLYSKDVNEVVDTDFPGKD